MRICSILIVLLLIGCSTKCEPTRIEPNVIVKTVEVKVPVGCNVPKVECDFQVEGFLVIEKMRQCIIEQKRALEVCALPVNEE